MAAAEKVFSTSFLASFSFSPIFLQAFTRESDNMKKYAGPLPEVAVVLSSTSSLFVSKFSVIISRNFFASLFSLLDNTNDIQVAMPSETESPRFGIILIIFLCPLIWWIFFMVVPARTDMSTESLFRYFFISFTASFLSWGFTDSMTKREVFTLSILSSLSTPKTWILLPLLVFLFL